MIGSVDYKEKRDRAFLAYPGTFSVEDGNQWDAAWEGGYKAAIEDVVESLRSDPDAFKRWSGAAAKIEREFEVE